MISFFDRSFHSVVFWGAWLIIPFLMEFIPAMRSIFILHKRHKDLNERRELKFFPDVTLIVPVYNSEKTLFNCLRSINDSTYPNKHLHILLVNNKQGESGDFDIYARAQKTFPSLLMQWLESSQGKSRALNMALYSSDGKYIFNVDSDGVFDKHAIMNMVEKFEANEDIACMTGTVLTDPRLIKKEKGFWHRVLCRLEFMEYAQAFLAGRSYAAKDNEIYTLSGAFSAFRKDAVLKSRMYNTSTICEDTQMTFQMKYLYGKKVEICEDAIFYVDPIENVQKLYTQRQRWQRGSLEVSKMFQDRFSFRNALRAENVRTVLYDHTFAFPRAIWYVITLYLIIIKYSRDILILTSIFIYLMYVIIGIAYFRSAVSYMGQMPETKKFYKRNFGLVFLLPFYTTEIYLFRMAGIVNSIGTDSAWKTRNMKEEAQAVGDVIRRDFTDR